MPTAADRGSLARERGWVFSGVIGRAAYAARVSENFAYGVRGVKFGSARPRASRQKSSPAAFTRAAKPHKVSYSLCVCPIFNACGFGPHRWQPLFGGRVTSHPLVLAKTTPIHNQNSLIELSFQRRFYHSFADWREGLLSMCAHSICTKPLLAQPLLVPLPWNDYSIADYTPLVKGF